MQADRTHQPRADSQPQPAEDKQHPPQDVSSTTVCLCVAERNYVSNRTPQSMTVPLCHSSMFVSYGNSNKS